MLSTGLASLYAKGYGYCTRCEKFYPPSAAIRCLHCTTILRKKSKTSSWNKGRDDYRAY